MGGVSQNGGFCLDMEEGVVFLEIPHDVAKGKNFDLFIFTNKCVLQDNLNKNNMIGIAVVLIVLIVIWAVLIINANKNSD